MAAPIIDTNTRGQGHRLGGKRRWRIAVKLAATAVAASALVGGINFDNARYIDHLDIIRSQSVRNTNHDNSLFRDVKADEIVQADHLGPRSDYLGDPNGNNEPHFPTDGGGQFRTSCEFSHFAYDDPILFPDQPGAAHLHMFFGNTDVNAYTTQETLEDSGSSTCNGQELNRSGYWAPAVFDGDGNVRVPERNVIYYKAEVFNNGDRDIFQTNNVGDPNPGAQAYPRGARAIAPNPSIADIPSNQGGHLPSVNFKCTHNFSFGDTALADASQGIPLCDGNDTASCAFAGAYPACRKVLEMEIQFWTCFPTYDENNPNDPNNPDITDWTLWGPPDGGDWFQSDCDNGFIQAGPYQRQESYAHFRYFVNYVIEPGEDTSGWHLSSDVDPGTLNQTTPSLVGVPGGTLHGDAWWSWDTETYQQALDNCINFHDPNARSGCGFGYLTNAGPDNANPLPGPALKYRPQFDTPGDSASYKVPASQIFNELCVPLGTASHSFVTDRHAAYCNP